MRHLENLQRKGGFKGFNQHAVRLIIAETDPRKQKSAGAPANEAGPGFRLLKEIFF